MNILIRPIQFTDNIAVEKLARTILKEVKCTGPGLTTEDPELKRMYEAYQKPGSRYWVVIDLISKKLVGAGGFSRLKGTVPEENICELQKVYFYPFIRGLGLGKQFLQMILAEALECGYREMYLETLPTMDRAVELYKKLGFITLKGPKGSTGHYGKEIIHMSKELKREEVGYDAFNSLVI